MGSPFYVPSGGRRVNDFISQITSAVIAPATLGIRDKHVLHHVWTYIIPIGQNKGNETIQYYLR